MNRYDFNTVIDRRGTDAVKTDGLTDFFGRSDLLAAWVADMDFATPDFIIDALRERLNHPVLGYTREPADYRQSIMDWERELHGWEIRPEWLSYIPGIVKGIGLVINVFTKPGDDVVIMPPVYHPFRIIPESNGRNVVKIAMLTDDAGRYYIDYDALERLDTKGGILLLANPHNPAGRIWSPEELRRLAEICRRKNLLVVSDEIHADMALNGATHTPFATVSDDALHNSITFCAPSKTFNIPGIVSSFSVVPDDEIRNRFYGWLQPGIHAQIPEASFLMWLDCRGLGLDHDSLVDLFVNKARVALNDGAMFGEEGTGFMRLNVAAPRSVILQILDRIKDAVCGNNDSL